MARFLFGAGEAAFEDRLQRADHLQYGSILPTRENVGVVAVGEK